MTPVLIRFPEDELEALDAAVEEERQGTRESVSRAALVRRAVRKMLKPAEAWVDLDQPVDVRPRYSADGRYLLFGRKPA